MKRLLLLHGYTEDRTIFDTLRPLLPSFDEVLSLELEEEFAGWHPAGRPNVLALAQHLADRYQISAADVLIGHSMGGWIAAHLKQLTGATAILLSSFTDQRKIVSAIRSPRLLSFYALSGLMQARFMRERFKRNYRRDESRQLYAQLVDNLARHRRRYVHQQLQVLFAPAPPLTVPPDLRLHARRDNVIRLPDEPFVELPGDHFAHYFYPQPAAEAIREFLSKK
ncbi:alpha/beta fold hydrolase [Hymenobacter baengnokdamensis]|uniref:alpha/beta fold hydrolase n=1 Tax=Hymenobacter baengnokdamensis TaxID=2615203 RepID=UPI0012452590|nr:alpha/beta hydrolase [Hymenobacter baengnokdamensis]